MDGSRRGRWQISRRTLRFVGKQFEQRGFGSTLTCFEKRGRTAEVFQVVCPVGCGMAEVLADGSGHEPYNVDQSDRAIEQQGPDECRAE